MQLGGQISEEDMHVLRSTLKYTPMYDASKQQMETGLQGYRNDERAWDFESPELIDTMGSIPARKSSTGGG